MQLLPPRQDEIFVHRLAGERVAESIHARAVGRNDELLLNARRQRGLNHVLLRAGECQKDVIVQLRAEDGGCSKDVCVIRIHPLNACEDVVRHAPRDRELRKVFALPFPGLRPIDVPAIDRFLQHLLEHERVPFAPLVEEVAELLADLVHVEDRAHHRLDLRSVERFELDHFGASGPSPPLHDRRQRVLAMHLVPPIGR